MTENCVLRSFVCWYAHFASNAVAGRSDYGPIEPTLTRINNRFSPTAPSFGYPCGCRNAVSLETCTGSYWLVRDDLVTRCAQCPCENHLGVQGVRFRRMLLLSLLIGAAFSPPTEAQLTKRGSQRLSLTDAITLADKQNLDLAAARAQRAVADAGVRAAGERPNPTLSVGASRDAPHENVLIDQPLEIGPERSRRIEVARQEIALTETDIETMEKQVRRSVREAYFALAHALTATAQQDDIVKLADRLLDISKS